MKTLRTTNLIVLLFIANFAISQNLLLKTPKELSDEQKISLKNIKELPIPEGEILKKSTLPLILDNSSNKFFPEISYQQDWSCGQQSGVHYMFTYEMNCARDANSFSTDNLYATHFTWNNMNGSEFEIGASYFDSWKIIKEFGHPNITTFDPGNDNVVWMNGYDNYLASMNNRIENIYSIRVDTEEGLLKLKNWLYDHAGESEYGGIANYYGTSNYYNFLPMGTPEAGKQVITQMYDIATHALTIVGYNDNIRYDFNEDGIFTNDRDINNDGIVNIQDWEIGGFIVANSFSADWGNNGFTYVMYKLAAEPPEVGGFWNNTVNVITVKENYSPKLTLKASIRYTSRHRIKVMAGFASDTTATAPEIIKEFPIFNYQGGPVNMQGGFGVANETIEFGLDISDFYTKANSNEFSKFFLIVNENDYPEYADGGILSFSVIDHTDNDNETAAHISSAYAELNHGENTVSLVKKLNDIYHLNISNWTIPVSHPNEPFEVQMTATGGTPPYTWSIVQNEYSKEIIEDKFDRATPNSHIFPTALNSKIKIDLDFTFPFYGKDYNSIYITTNGSILFEDDLVLYPYVFFREYALANRKGISVFGANDQVGGYYHNAFSQTYPGEAIQVYWNMGHYYMSAVSFEYRAKLYSDGTIEFNFNQFDALGQTWISGISNGNGSEYVRSPIENSRWISDSTVVRFTPPTNYFPELSIDENGLLKGIAPNEIRETRFKIKVTDFSGASTVKEFYYNTWPNSINENEAIDNIHVFPNPTNGEINIKYEKLTPGITKIELIDISGKKLLSLLNSHEKPGKHIFTLQNLKQHINSGYYFIQINTDKKMTIPIVIY
jgi:type IX secretion system substrate protein